MEECDDVIDWAAEGIPGLLVLFTLIEDVVSCLNWCFFTGVGMWFIWKKLLPVFADRGMVGDESSDSHGKWVGSPNMF